MQGLCRLDFVGNIWYNKIQMLARGALRAPAEKWGSAVGTAERIRMKRKVYMPDYYPEFKCLAEKCRYSCCQEWGISVSRGEYNKIRNAHKSKELQEIVKQTIKRNRDSADENGYARYVFNPEGFCPLVTQGGLCQLQAECGFATLPNVCKNFPRLESQSPGRIEHLCTTGCEKVVDMLMDRPQGIRFIETMGEPFFTTFRELDYAVAFTNKPITKHFAEVQLLCIRILQNRHYSMDHRMLLLGLALQSLQKLQTDYTDEGMDTWLRQTHIYVVEDDSLKATLDNLPINTKLSMGYTIFMCKNIPTSFVRYYQAINEIFDQLKIVYHAEDNSNTFEPRLYQNAKDRLRKYLADTDYIFENIMVNHFFEMGYPLRGRLVWENYMLLCQFFNFFKFVVSGYMTEERGREDLLYIITLCSRVFFHNLQRLPQHLLDRLNEDGSTTLAHMATIING